MYGRDSNLRLLFSLFMQTAIPPILAARPLFIDEPCEVLDKAKLESIGMNYLD